MGYVIPFLFFQGQEVSIPKLSFIWSCLDTWHRLRFSHLCDAPFNSVYFVMQFGKQNNPYVESNF